MSLDNILKTLKELDGCDTHFISINQNPNIPLWLQLLGYADWETEKYFILKDLKMQPNEYVKLVTVTESCDWDSIRRRLTTAIPNIRLLHGAIGICTEAGEIQDIIKKFLFYDKPLDLAHLKEELGDLLWYVGLMASVLENGISDGDLESIMKSNINKLRVRYPSKFTTYDALNRDLYKEKEALEK